MGQLLKLHFVSPDMIINCIETLVDKHDEKLEALCKLLKIVGKDLDQVNLYLSTFMIKIVFFVHNMLL